MNIECFKNHNTPYLRLVASLGLKKVNGKTVHRRKNVLNLGPLSRHDDGKPDYLRRLRESFKAGKPLIKALEPYVGDTPKGRVTITFEEGDAKCLGEPKRMAATMSQNGRYYRPLSPAPTTTTSTTRSTSSRGARSRSCGA